MQVAEAIWRRLTSPTTITSSRLNINNYLPTFAPLLLLSRRGPGTSQILPRTLKKLKKDKKKNRPSLTYGIAASRTSVIGGRGVT